MIPIDLHIHSWHSSDGELSIGEILKESRRLGMKTIAITDHNRVGGVAEALRHGEQLGIEVIPGIEIDCSFQGIDLHLLGYYVDERQPELQRLGEEMEARELQAFPRVLAELRKLGLVVDPAALLQKAAGNVPSPELIAEVLLADPASAGHPLLEPYRPGGSRSDMPYLNFYRDFMAQGKAAHVPLELLRLEDAVELVRQCRGIPVIAHPGDNLREQPELIDAVIGQGVLGIEAFSNYHSAAQTEYFCRKARAHRVLVTGGSDFHGKNKPTIGIGGYDCPADPLEWLGELRRARAGLLP
ncbi:hypothetical protein EDC14_102631 [Hydrogenispora ethanolica]|uniref:Polymerase/histidinol phosphatase N-terminal domain-containing protein n=1 Tax=Hydrogenispora ethanolica TaxID=1082276 RepID=A0A4R1R9E5_HYDET|nr:PHP domain-containing protein [Hydrogenispora ethanolica]TCL62288.1 hypothetical protein EDC14_102631 [Hydrogenispora ethanolica]